MRTDTLLLHEDKKMTKLIRIQLENREFLQLCLNDEELKILHPLIVVCMSSKGVGQKGM